MMLSKVHVKTQIESILNTKPPIDLGEYGNSVFYTISILSLIDKSLHTLGDYINALDDFSLILNHEKYKKKLALYSKRELFLILIKFCFRASFFNSQDTKNIFKKIQDAISSYAVTTDEVTRQYMAIHPAAFNIDQVNIWKNQIDEMMFILVASRYAPVGDRNDYSFIIRVSFSKLLPVFHYYGLNEFGKGSEYENIDLLLDAQRDSIINVWLYEDKNEKIRGLSKSKYKNLANDLIFEYYDNQLESRPDEQGKQTIGTRKEFREAEKNRQIARALKTLSNLSGGIAGVIGFAIGGDKGSDLGATCDAIGNAALQGVMGKQYYENVGKTVLSDQLSLKNMREDALAKQLQLSESSKVALRSTAPLLPQPKISNSFKFPKQLDLSKSVQFNTLTQQQNRGTEQPLVNIQEVTQPNISTQSITNFPNANNLHELSENFLSSQSNLRIITITYKGKLTVSPADANFLRFAVQWAQSAGIAMRIGSRGTEDSVLRASARNYMDSQQISRTNLHAMHPVDSVINPFLDIGTTSGTTYYFGNDSVNMAFGGQLGRQLRGLAAGTRIGIRFVGFPTYIDVPPSAPPASPPNLSH